MPTKPPDLRELLRKQAPTQSYDQWRGSASSRGYTARWARYSIAYRKAHPLCVMCQAEGRITPAGCVDHIIDIDVRRDLFWDPSNHQSLCIRHNTLKSAGKSRLS